MFRRPRNALLIAALIVMASLAGCRASGEIDVDDNGGDSGVEVDVGDER